MDQLQCALAGEGFLVFDGAMGTMLQRHIAASTDPAELLCLTNPQVITDIHHAYAEAGSQVATTNTFGANAMKLEGAATVAEVFAAAVKCARDSGVSYVAADIGPSGELLFPMGDFTFSEAYDLFAEQARAAQAAGADLVIVETMADLLEMVAAVVAVKESCSLPVVATMTFTESGRTYMGASPKTAALVLSALGVDALGVNCSVGPDNLQPVVNEMLEVAACPVIVQANAGLPQVVDGKTVYTLPPDEYAAAIRPMVEAGATIIGGCCGTDPDYIREIVKMLEGCTPNSEPLEKGSMLEIAREVADEGGRDEDILCEILDASDFEELKEALRDEYDE